MGFGDNAAIVTSRTNARVKQLRAAFVGQARLSGGMVAIEGEKLLGEAVRSGIAIETLFVSARGGVVNRNGVPGFVAKSVEVVWLSEDVFASAVETQAPQGVAGLVRAPVKTLEDVMSASSDASAPLILVAAGLQDPGNLGTLVRSAEAFGASGVLTTAGTVSAWNQKALRASAGSVFRVPVVAVGMEELAELKARGVRLMAAVAAGAEGVVAAQDADFAGAVAVMIGNEGAGLSEELVEMADVKVTIPCPGMVESLNAAVAGSLLLYEAARGRSVRVDTKAKADSLRE